MKKGRFWILYILIVWFGIFNGYRSKVRHKKEMEAITELKIMVQQRAVKDTLYWEHLEKCAFINKDNIGIGHQGYLYDKYHRKYIRK
jgi:hypothetical protein